MNDSVQTTTQRSKDRLSFDATWFPYPALIVIGLVLTITLFVSFTLNPRLGNPATPFRFNAAPTLDTSIWLSLSTYQDDVVVTTSDKQVFRWNKKVNHIDDMHNLIDYLKQKGEVEVLSAALAKKLHQRQTTVVISVDQTMNYAHVRPLLYALAQANINKYAFETQIENDG